MTCFTSLLHQGSCGSLSSRVGGLVRLPPDKAFYPRLSLTIDGTGVKPSLSACIQNHVHECSLCKMAI